LHRFGLIHPCDGQTDAMAKTRYSSTMLSRVKTCQPMIKTCANQTSAKCNACTIVRFSVESLTLVSQCPLICDRSV